MNISLRRCVRSLSSSIIPSRLGNGPSLKEFLDSAVTSPSSSPSQSTSIFDQNINIDQDQEVATNAGLKFYIETYGCQMNTSDSEIVRSILLTKGHVFCEDIDSADLILTNTCAIRENAENKVWHRLQFFQSMKSKSKQKIKSTVDSSSNSNNNSNNINNKSNQRSSGFPIVGVLGCMAERLKTKLLEEKAVDFVCGPDAYRDIPRLLDTVLSSGQKEANTRLSLDETYADIEPVRATNSASAFVSIMRGCNNMCAFCIVPFTRGRERSREHASILQEVAQLSEQGVREVVLLGQNVNGYHDITIQSSIESHPLKDNANTKYQASPGFKNMFHSRVKDQAGVRFADLLRDVAAVDPEIRVRFTSPHPKDFPPEVLDAIASTHNICKSIHLPVQSGSSNCLERMRRGYTREAFLSLVDNMRTLMPQLTLSTDVIAGFCGETDAEHADTVSLMRQVAFDQAFMFAYSLRDKTHAAHTMVSTHYTCISIFMNNLCFLLDIL